MFRGMWEVVETKVGKIGVVETKGRRGKERSRKKIGRERREKEKEIEEEKNNRSKEGS